MSLALPIELLRPLWLYRYRLLELPNLGDFVLFVTEKVLFKC